MFRRIIAVSLGCALMASTSAQAQIEEKKFNVIGTWNFINNWKKNEFPFWSEQIAKDFRRQDHGQHQVHHRGEPEGHRIAASSQDGCVRHRGRFADLRRRRRRRHRGFRHLGSCHQRRRSAQDSGAVDARDAEGHEGALTWPSFMQRPGTLKLPCHYLHQLPRPPSRNSGLPSSKITVSAIASGSVSVTAAAAALAAQQRRPGMASVTTSPQTSPNVTSALIKNLATRIPNTSLESGGWEDQIIWDETDFKGFPNAKLILNLNDPNLLFEAVEIDNRKLNRAEKLIAKRLRKLKHLDVFGWQANRHQFCQATFRQIQSQQ